MSRSTEELFPPTPKREEWALMQIKVEKGLFAEVRRRLAKERQAGKQATYTALVTGLLKRWIQEDARK